METGLCLHLDVKEMPSIGRRVFICFFFFFFIGEYLFSVQMDYILFSERCILIFGSSHYSQTYKWKFLQVPCPEVSWFCVWTPKRYILEAWLKNVCTMDFWPKNNKWRPCPLKRTLSQKSEWSVLGNLATDHDQRFCLSLRELIRTTWWKAKDGCYLGMCKPKDILLWSKKTYLVFFTGHLLSDQDQFLQLPTAEEEKDL